jgi:hypothetical protein
MDETDKDKLIDILNNNDVEWEHSGWCWTGITIYAPIDLLPKEAKYIVQKYLD